MKIYNIRLGHACNSSSSHSIVPLAALGGGPIYDRYTPGEFGWDHFVLGSPGAKMEYLAATLSGRMEPEAVTALTGVEPGPHDEWSGPFGYVDHQSVMALPLEGPFADEFLSDLADYLKRDDVVILGGNDNGGDPPISAHLPLQTEAAPPALRPGVTPDGTKYWVSMVRRTGDKVRFSFEGQPLRGSGYEWELEEQSRPDVVADVLDLPYADAPELVDMKITGFCPFEKDCPWCYMGSDRDGQHAPVEDVLAWVDAFADAGVFEIALGGGEPTLWPGLDRLVERAGERQINVNLTTKNIAWFSQPQGRKILPGLGAVAVSMNNDRDLDRLEAFLEKDSKADIGEQVFSRWYGGDSVELTVQCVPAFCSDEFLTRLVDWAAGEHRRITFLGVKRTGRAKDEEAVDDLRWLDQIRRVAPEHGGWVERGVAVDTLLAAASEEAFKELGISHVWYGVTEGAFSCYVDATAGQLGPGSYSDSAEFVDVTQSVFLGAFRSAQRLAGIRP
jgi:pyruvate-formate lyase-activating enzyme